MLREAELFVFAEKVLVEVVGRIRPADRDIMVPPIVDLPDPPAQRPMWSVREQYVLADLGVPHVLTGDTADRGNRAAVRRALDGADQQAEVVRAAEMASASAATVSDGDAAVHAGFGTVSTGNYLLRLTVNRALVAHYVASYLGSTACPLPEELAHPLHESSKPYASAWRAAGLFGEPLPVPSLASWRDTFLLSAGHLPHPLGH